MAVVVFDPAQFKLVYPSFATLTDAQLQYAFRLATLYLNNTDSSIVCDVGERTTLLYLLTAHIAALTYGENGQGPRPLVGRISSATEGSVSVSAEYNVAPGSAQWYAQTGYGAQYWEATAKYRVGRYRPAPSGYAVPVVVPWRP
ncbi:DUF4054 domain-containing protein [Bordetella hinzii]|uniref:DUF4054 domain-containing protein n=1 Tax=Bordetella hinzii TaxID=103855 RepID=UPI001153C9B9|nr:DUF4054 domain-containing protein [Bordetella hinzii]QDJ35837.1 hypothetical protein CBR67_03760 [Bordetella hinzii]QDJ44807.1 hypothetical protein CBR71_02775 [Bordetella hinzii]